MIPIAIARQFNGEPSPIVPILATVSAIAVAYGFSRWLDRPGVFRTAWISLTVLACGWALWWSSNQAPGSLVLLTLMPLLATFLHSARGGGWTAVACCGAFLMPWLFPRTPPVVGAEFLMLGATAATGAWALGAYLEWVRGKSVERAQSLAAQLERSEERFRSYVEYGRDLITEFDEAGNVLYMSPGHEQLLGRTPLAFQERGGQTNVHSDDHRDLLEYFGEVLQGDRSRSCGVRYIHPDGNLIWLNLRGNTYRNAEGKTRVVLRAHDETRKRLADQEREDLLSELQNALDNVKALKGIIPICATCKKIRRGDGEWEPLEVYLTEHSNADLSHGLCEDCLAKTGY